MTEYIGAVIEIFIPRHMLDIYYIIIYFSVVQYNALGHSSSRGGVMSSLCRVEVPRKLLLHRNQLMPPLEIGFERFEENIWLVQKFRYRSQKNGTVQLA